MLWCVVKAWPVLLRSLDQYRADGRIIERACRCFRFAMRCLGTRSFDLFDPIVTKVRTTCKLPFYWVNHALASNLFFDSPLFLTCVHVFSKARWKLFIPVLPAGADSGIGLLGGRLPLTKSWGWSWLQDTAGGSLQCSPRPPSCI